MQWIKKVLKKMIYGIGAFIAIIWMFLVLKVEKWEKEKALNQETIDYEDAEAFFLSHTDPAHKNYKNRYLLNDIDTIIKHIGPQDHYVDWDFGRFIYGWKTPNYFIRVSTQSGGVREIELLTPGSNLSSTTVLKVLLDNHINKDDSFKPDDLYKHLTENNFYSTVHDYLANIKDIDKNILDKLDVNKEGFVEYLLNNTLEHYLYELRKNERPHSHTFTYLQKADDGSYSLFGLERGNERVIGAYATRESAITDYAESTWQALERQLMAYLDKK